jgi:hypothetical protein
VSKGRFNRNTTAQDVRVKVGIKSDADSGELTAKDFAEAVPFCQDYETPRRPAEGRRQRQGR